MVVLIDWLQMLQQVTQEHVMKIFMVIARVKIGQDAAFQYSSNENFLRELVRYNPFIFWRSEAWCWVGGIEEILRQDAAIQLLLYCQKTKNFLRELVRYNISSLLPA